MGTKMTHTARAELTQVVRRRYCAATGTEKRKILDEFIAALAATPNSPTVAGVKIPQ